MRTQVIALLSMLSAACSPALTQTETSTAAKTGGGTRGSDPAPQQTDSKPESKPDTKAAPAERADKTEKTEKSDKTEKADKNSGKADKASSKAAKAEADKPASSDASKRAKPGLDDYEVYGKPAIEISSNPPGTIKLTVPLQARDCYSFSVQLDKDMQSGKLTIYDPNGKAWPLGDASGQKTEALCAPASGEYRAELEVLKGKGKVSLQPYKLKLPPASASESRQQLDTLAKNVADGLAAASPVYTILAPPSEANVMFKLEKNSCYDFLSAADAGVEQVHMALIEPAGHRLIEDDTPSPRKHFSHCVEATGLYRAAFNVVRGSGEIAFQVFRNPAKLFPVPRASAPRRITVSARSTAPEPAKGRWPVMP